MFENYHYHCAKSGSKPCVHTTTEMCIHIQIFTTVRIDFPVL